MKLLDHKIDATVQEYSKKWLKSLERPRVSTILSNFLISFLYLFWSSALTTMFGFNLKKGIGTLIFIGIWLAFTLATFLALRAFSKLGVDRPISSAFLLSTITGLYVNLVTYHDWDLPVLSHMIGFGCSIVVFLFILIVDKLLIVTPPETE